MADTGDINIGSVIRFNGELNLILEYQHRTPGNLRAFFQAKMRNVITGKLAETRFRAGEAIEVVRLEYRTLQFIYKENNFLVCMDNETFEQLYIPALLFGDNTGYLKEGVEVKVSFEGETPITAEGPTFVDLLITYSEPGIKGDTATNAMKPATLETGAIVNVPLFVNEGEKIRVDTRTNTYVERVK